MGIPVGRAVDEYMAWSETTQQVLRHQTLQDLPLLVISASDRENGDQLANEHWWTLHQGMASLSSQGEWTVVPKTAHQSLIMKETAAVMVLERIKPYIQQ